MAGVTELGGAGGDRPKLAGARCACEDSGTSKDRVRAVEADSGGVGRRKQQAERAAVAIEGEDTLAGRERERRGDGSESLDDAGATKIKARAKEQVMNARAERRCGRRRGRPDACKHERACQREEQKTESKGHAASFHPRPRRASVDCRGDCVNGKCPNGFLRTDAPPTSDAFDVLDVGHADIAGLLRAERAGNGTDQYRLTDTGRDIAGNTAQCATLHGAQHPRRAGSLTQDHLLDVGSTSIVGMRNARDRRQRHGTHLASRVHRRDGAGACCARARGGRRDRQVDAVGGGRRTARAQGVRVMLSRPAEAERGLGYLALADLFDGVVDEVLPKLLTPRRRARPYRPRWSRNWLA